ncbi:MAG: hypothetical protein CMJ49_01775 [Planctomycetaceae bacterium]|nr:hypothetical protein [Planctomycetaceae bacterium]
MTLAELTSDARSQAAWMLLLVLLLLGGYLLVVTVMVVGRIRRRRSQRTARTSPQPLVDPWVEAGRRLEVPADPDDADDSGSSEGQWDSD